MELDLANLVDYRPSLIGTMSVIGGTAVGAPIDCKGFQSCLAIVSAGSLVGSTGSTVTLSFKIQESATPTGTGANWTDITNEAISVGSFTVPSITFGDDIAGGTTTGTWLGYETTKKSGKLSDGNRQRYIRFHASLAGTVGLGPRISCGFLMCNPVDTYYLSSAVVQPSGNVEVSRLL